jgi:hypothetical protein
VRRPMNARCGLATVVLVWAAAFASPRAAAAPLPERPRFQLAVGLGASVDRNAPNPTPDRPITAFFFTAGLGEGSLGLDLRAFANGATTNQVTRLALEAIAVLRPLERGMREVPGYGARVLRAASVDVGPALERVSRGPLAGRRFGFVLGTHLDLPIGIEGSPKEVRVRLGLRRLHAGHATLGDIDVHDSALEIYAQLAFVF